MAFFVNNKHVKFYVLIQNDEILLLNKTLEKSGQILNSTRLKCSNSTTNSDLTVANDNSQSKSQDRQTRVLSSSASNCGDFVVACDSNSAIHLWRRDKSSWSLLNRRKSVRKCQKVIFTNSSSEIILADRGGDVFIFPVLDSDKEGKFALGHICFITDISMSPDDKFLATCDRDGKIRVSCYPNSYNIYSYCLGHEEFVSAIQFVELDGNLLLSCSGDGTVRLWDYKNGSNGTCENMCENSALCDACKVDFKNVDDIQSNGMPSKNPCTHFSVQGVRFSKEHSLLAVLYYFLKGIAVYKFSGKKFQFIHYINLPDIVVDALFIETGDLIVLLKQTPNALYSFRYDDKVNVFVQCKDDAVSNVAREIHTFYGNFRTVMAHTADELMLFKKLFDSNDDDDECKSKKNKVA